MHNYAVVVNYYKRKPVLQLTTTFRQANAGVKISSRDL